MPDARIIQAPSRLHSHFHHHFHLRNDLPAVSEAQWDGPEGSRPLFWRGETWKAGHSKYKSVGKACWFSTREFLVYKAQLWQLHLTAHLGDGSGILSKLHSDGLDLRSKLPIMKTQEDIQQDHSWCLLRSSCSRCALRNQHWYMFRHVTVIVNNINYMYIIQWFLRLPPYKKKSSVHRKPLQQGCLECQGVQR